jgi:hypothetical protein
VREIKSRVRHTTSTAALPVDSLRSNRNHQSQLIKESNTRPATQPHEVSATGETGPAEHAIQNFRTGPSLRVVTHETGTEPTIMSTFIQIYCSHSFVSGRPQVRFPKRRLLVLRLVAVFSALHANTGIISRQLPSASLSINYSLTALSP